MNWLWTMLLGIGGAVAVSWLGTQLGFNTRSGLDRLFVVENQ